MAIISTLASRLHWFALACALAATAMAGCSVSSDVNPPAPDAGGQGTGGSAPDATGGSGGGAPTDAPPERASGTGGAPVSDDAAITDGPGDASAPITDGASIDAPAGKVSHRFLNSISDKGILALVAKDGQIEWQFNVMSLGSEANDAWVLANGNIAFAYVKGAREMTPAKEVVWNYAAPAGTEVQSCQPLPNGNFLIGEAHDGGIGMLREIDGTGKVVSTVTVTEPGGFSPHNQFREVRKTPQGTFLVTYLQSNKAVEFDATGKQLRQFACGSFVAIRLPNGNTLSSCGDAHRVIEVDPQDKIVWEVTESEIPGNRLGFAAGLQRLANGNTVICNWPGHAGAPNQPQAFELTRDKKVVWEVKNPQLGWTSNIEVMDPEARIDGIVLR
jgi:outer membrane protein assembly factor BamB